METQVLPQEEQQALEEVPLPLEAQAPQREVLVPQQEVLAQRQEALEQAQAQVLVLGLGQEALRRVQVLEQAAQELFLALAEVQAEVEALAEELEQEWEQVQALQQEESEAPQVLAQVIDFPKKKEQ